MNCATWNVRGLNKEAHQNEVIRFISTNKLSLVGLLETKVKKANSYYISKKVARSWKWLFNYDYHENGRVWVGWDNNVWDLNMVDASEQHISCVALFREKQLSFLITFVYAQNRGYERSPLWNYISNVTATLPWVLMGDFNCVVSLHEINGGREHWNSEMQDFKDCLISANLSQVRTSGSCFTWCNNRTNDAVHKRLDRVLCNPSWLSCFPLSNVTILNRGIMDHSPLLLYVPMDLEKYSKPFQFFNVMLELPGFAEVVKNVWDTRLYGDPMAILVRKLQLLKIQLVTLNKKNGNVQSNVELARVDLAGIQNSLSLNVNDPILLIKEHDAIACLNRALEAEEIFLKQKSRVKWLNCGDGNNKYFFNQVRTNWNCNKILAIHDSRDVLVQGHSNVVTVAVDYFKEILGNAPSPLSRDLSFIECPTLSDAMAELLTRPFSNEEIWQTLKKMKKGKSPGPDGFNVEFFVSCWDIVGQNFCEAIQAFFETSRLHSGINSTSIALIPKTVTPSRMQDFRPISLCTVAYKCLSKLMANRLKRILPSVIDQAQSAFIPGRSISDNIIMAQELFRGYTRETGTSKCALKVDLHKAFDSLHWDFLIELLHKMNFPPKFIGWIEACVCSTKFSVKVNGTLNGYFNGARGLRQGDPLSPYLFTIAMNALSCMLNNTPNDFKFHWKCKELKITHLFFADDVLFFCHGNKSSISHIMNCLDLFAALSGLTPSLTKSSCFMANCDTAIRSWFDDTFGMPHGEIPVRFLGVPLISSKLSINDCTPLIHRITAKLDSWTTMFLSFAGRVILVRAVLFAIQAFWSNHFLLPKMIHKQLQSLFTRFLWRGDVSKTGGVKVAWSSVCLPRSEGGLGLRCPVAWNKAQIMMHLWRLITKKKSLWVDWVQGTVLKRNAFWTIPIPTDCSWFWRKLLRLREVVLPHISVRLGNGAKTLFWLDPWWRQTCIANSFKDNLIANANSNPLATVNSFIFSGSWMLPVFNNHQHNARRRFSSWLHGFSPPAFDLSKEDTWLWDDHAKVTSSFIWDSIRERGHLVDWADGVWFKGGVRRYAHHSWLLCWGRLHTLARLQRLGIDTLTSCFLCAGGIETDSHLFLHCPYSSFIVETLLDSMNLGIDWPHFQSWSSLIVHISQIQDKGKRFIALLTLQVFAYHLWRERNARSHNKGSFPPQHLMMGIRKDIKACLASSIWFSKEVVRRPEIYLWIA